MERSFNDNERIFIMSTKTKGKPSTADLAKWQMDAARARQMTDIAWKGVQSYISPNLAKQIVSEFGITEGWCLDVGAGHGRLGIELAKITNLNVYTVDLSPHMIEIATEKVRQHGLAERFKLFTAPAEKLPLPSNCCDLVVSRGAMGFFQDKPAAMREIHRVLKPGGVTYIGGGDCRTWVLPPIDIVKKIRFNLQVRQRFQSPEWRQLWLTRPQWEEVLAEAGVSRYVIHPKRLWIQMIKESPSP